MASQQDLIREALALLQRAEQEEQQSAVAPDSTGPTFAALWQAFKAEKGHLAAFKTEVGRVEGQLLPFLGRLPWHQVTLVLVDKYRAKRRADTTARGGPPSPATRNREVELIRRVLRFALKRKVIKYDPIDGLEKEPENNARECVLTDYEVSALMAHLPLWVRVLMVVLYDSGMRIGEALQLQWGQVDWEPGLVDIRASTAKGKRGRTTILSDRSRDALRLLQRRRDNPYVFSSPRNIGEPYSYHHVYALVREAAEKAGISAPGGGRPWIHDLRRSFVTLARRAGASETDIMQATGHRTRAAFERYSITGTEDLMRVQAVVNRRGKTLPVRR